GVSSPRFGAGRVFLDGDLAILEETFVAQANGRAIGENRLRFDRFDASGKIVDEHVYQNRQTLEEQKAGDPNADALPAFPSGREVHEVSSGPGDAALGQWARDFDAAALDVPRLATMVEDGVHYDCALGPHFRSKAEIMPALQHFATAFPDQQYSIERLVVS